MNKFYLFIGVIITIITIGIIIIVKEKFKEPPPGVFGVIDDNIMCLLGVKDSKYNDQIKKIGEFFSVIYNQDLFDYDGKTINPTSINPYVLQTLDLNSKSKLEEIIKQIKIIDSDTRNIPFCDVVCESKPNRMWIPSTSECQCNQGFTLKKNGMEYECVPTESDKFVNDRIIEYAKLNLPLKSYFPNMYLTGK